MKTEIIKMYQNSLFLKSQKYHENISLPKRAIFVKCKFVKSTAKYRRIAFR